MMFDIKVEAQSDGYVNYHHAILCPKPIKPVKLSRQGECSRVKNLHYL
jgi:hypothetical protein